MKKRMALIIGINFCCIMFAILLLMPVSSFALDREMTCCPGECKIKHIYLKTPPIKGDEVLEIQQALKYLSLYKGKLDGVYGAKTNEAVKKLQKNNGLQPTGHVTTATRRVLRECFEIPMAAKKDGGPKGKVRLEIYIKTRELIVYDDNKPFKTYKVAVGKRATPTPIGDFEITRKARDWGTGFGTRWMRISVPWGIFGIHGTNKPWSIGSRASHGCIRMFNQQVEELFEWVDVGTKVTIIGQVFPNRYEDRLVLKRGFKGSDVYQVQQRLKALGYLPAKPDGIYGPATIAAVKKFQKDHNFPVTGELDIDVYPAIGL